MKTRKHGPRRGHTALRAAGGVAILGLASGLFFVLQRKEPVVAAPDPVSLSESDDTPVAAPAAASAVTPTSTPSGVASRHDPDRGAAEAARIERYIDSLYSRKDVVSTFETAAGEQIDCIDFYAQPSVKIAMAQGHRIRLEDYRRLQAKQGPVWPPSRSAFDGQPDAEGRPRKCSDDAVPMVRTTVARIQAAGGLDAYLRTGRVAPPAPPQIGTQAPTDVPGFMHVDVDYSSANVGTIWGGQSIASIHAPNVPDPNGGQPHSLSQTWTTSGSAFFPCSDGQATGQACTSTEQASQCFQTIEVGWIVAPDSPKLGGDKNPHLFTFSTQDGYWATGCYDTAACTPQACEFNSQGIFPASQAAPCNNYPNGLVPNPIVIATGSPFTPGMSLASDVVATGSAPDELMVTTVWDEFAGWVIYVNGQLMAGFQPGTWDGSFYQLSNGYSPIVTTPGAPLETTKANIFQAGGEVAGGGNEAFALSGNPSVVEMGTGIGAVGGYKYAAYQRDIGVGLLNGTGVGIGPNDGYSYPAFSNPTFATDLNCYSFGVGLASGGPQTVSLTTQSLGYTFLEYPSGSPTTSYPSPGPGASNWENYLYFGGLGNFSGSPFSLTDPKGGTYDFCCSTQQQNGVNNDVQCPNSQLTDFCP
jgi:hypothetical protein